PGPSKCSWPTISSSERGRTRSASGAPGPGGVGPLPACSNRSIYLSSGGATAAPPDAPQRGPSPALLAVSIRTARRRMHLAPRDTTYLFVGSDRCSPDTPQRGPCMVVIIVSNRALSSRASIPHAEPGGQRGEVGEAGDGGDVPAREVGLFGAVGHERDAGRAGG